MIFEKIKYDDLNSRQKENYNFQKVSSLLADYGFSTIRLSDDWQGADFIAQHMNGDLFLKVQLKGRLTIDKKYLNKNIHICFRNEADNNFYLYPHDELLSYLINSRNIPNTESWIKKGLYSMPKLSKQIANHMTMYML